MNLPVREQRVLDGMESELGGCEPRLVSMFAIFNRLSRNDGAPRTESLRRVGRIRSALLRWGAKLRWASPSSGATSSPRAIIAIPIVLALVTLFVFLAVTNSAWHGCRPAVGPHGAGALQAVSCQPVPDSQGRS